MGFQCLESGDFVLYDIYKLQTFHLELREIWQANSDAVITVINSLLYACPYFEIQRSQVTVSVLSFSHGTWELLL